MNQNRDDPSLETDSDLHSVDAGDVSHPVGTGVGAAEVVDPTVEDAYWSANYLGRRYVERSRPYTDYRPAYRYGWESRARLGNRPFSNVESDLERGWDLARGESRLAWAQAKQATSDAWHRIACIDPLDATCRAH